MMGFGPVRLRLVRLVLLFFVIILVLLLASQLVARIVFIERLERAPHRAVVPDRHSRDALGRAVVRHPAPA